MKSYAIEVSIKIKEQKKESYLPDEVPFRFLVDENVPTGKNPVPYLASRLTEEVKRHSAAASDQIDWKTEDAEDDEEIKLEELV